MKKPGIKVNPIGQITGNSNFNEWCLPTPYARRSRVAKSTAPGNRRPLNSPMSAAGRNAF